MLVSPLTTRVRFTVTYDGTDFCGWQKQKHGDRKSVGHVIEEALSQVFNERIALFASGRTDAGVHAVNQVCHFTTSRTLQPGKNWDLCWAVNRYLPSTIVLKKAWLAPREFHATLSATHKTYRYLIWNQPRPSALLARNTTWVRLPIDIAHLQESSKFLMGKHDFRSFQTTGTPIKSTIRKIYQADWQWRRPGLLQFTITGSGFLKQMVRNIVGTALMLERRGFKPSEMQRILEMRDRRQAGPAAPPQGLYLMRVYYPQDLDIECLEL